MGKLIIYGGDIDEFLRCPYRLIKCKCEEIRPITLLNSEYVKEVLMKAGLEFEDKVTSQVEWQESTEPIEILLKRKAVIKHPVIELEGSQIIEKGFHYDFSDILFVGCPDMIVPDGKKSYSPLDIKNHKEVTRMDRLRISYYAFLLKFRFNMDLSKGFVLLKDEIIEEIDAQEAYEEVMKIIFKISEAKRGNPNIQYQPQRCEECQNCSLQFECLSVLKDGEDLTLLYGIGPARAERLKRAGIKNIKQLSEINPDNLKFWCSKNFLRKLQLCAKSFSENKIIKIGDIEVPQENIVYFDIETDLACERVWMIGYSYKGEFKQLYADNWEQEKHIITEFFDFLKYLDSPILFSYYG
jgi:predicted RecB family nuclease